MDHNPYTPPKATVAESAVAKGRRPMAVNVALTFLGVVLVNYVWNLGSEWRDLMTGETSNVSFVFQTVKAGAFAGLLMFIAQGRNWARHVALVWLLLSLLQFVEIWRNVVWMPEIRSFDSYLATVATASIPHVFALAALYLLYMPGKAWFRPVD